MSIRPALLALSVGLWGCAGNNTPLPTAPAETSPGSTGKLQSMDISTGARFKGALSKPAFFSTTSETTARNHGTNHAPTFNGSVGNQELTLLLPRGPSALLRFEGEPATDPDGDDVSYRFAFAVPGVSGIQTPSETLLRIMREGNSFAFHKNGEITPVQFTAVYGEVANIPTLPSAIYASDGNAESDPQVFNIHLVYDGSAQFSAPAEYVTDQRWEIPIPIEMYEGTTSPRGDELPRWTAVTDDHREWGFDWSPPLIRCEIVTAYYPYTLPDGGDDIALFSLSSEERATSGTVSLAFKTVPDFEAPGDNDADNQYRLRVVNTHNIHYLDNEGTPTGCSGSVLDLTIRVKDVGVPAPPGDIDAQFQEADDTTIDVEWATPGGFSENGALVAFPAGFEVTDYDYRYRAAGSVAWTEVTDSDLTETAGHAGELDRKCLRNPGSGHQRGRYRSMVVDRGRPRGLSAPFPLAHRVTLLSRATPRGSRLRFIWIRRQARYRSRCPFPWKRKAAQDPRTTPESLPISPLNPTRTCGPSS